MRLLLYINSLAMGGAERVLLKLAAHWLAAGHDVVVVTQTLVEQDQLPVAAGIHRVSTHTGGISGHWLRAILRNARRASRLKEELGRWSPDIVVSFLPTANVVALMAARNESVPVVVAERMFPAFLGLAWPQRMARDWLYPRAARVIVQTEESASWYRRRLGLENLAVIPNGVALPLDDQPPRVDPDSILPAGARIVLFIGRLAEPKLPEDAVRAFVRAFPDSPDWHLVLIGDGDKRSHVEAEITQSALGDRIHLLSRAGNIETWYRRAQMFLSVSRFEGFPNVLLEAMALGCVPLAYDCSTGPRDVIRHGDNGFLIPVGDIDALAQCMQRVATDAELRQKLSTRARAVLDAFSDDAFFTRWDGVLAAVTRRTQP